MRTVWKFTLPVQDEQWVEMPADAELLYVASQYEGQIATLQLWAKVDPERPTVNRLILIRGTGHPIGPDCSYIGSVIVSDGDLVWHVFDGDEEGAVRF